MWVWEVLPLAGGPAAIWGLTTRRNEKTTEPVTGQRPGSVPSWHRDGLWQVCKELCQVTWLLPLPWMPRVPAVHQA